MLVANIDAETRSKLEEILEIEFLESSIKLKDKETIVPSELYPLSKKSTMSLFTSYNTEELENDIIASVFNSADLQIGYCYANTLKLATQLRSKGISDIKTYTGWITPLTSVPIHHAWLVYKDKYLLDGGIYYNTQLMYLDYVSKNPNLSTDHYREVLARITVEEGKKPNTESRTFGKVSSLYWYIGTETHPDDGREIYNRMIKKFPQHPSYSRRGQNGLGASRIQEMIYQMQNT